MFRIQFYAAIHLETGFRLQVLLTIFITVGSFMRPVTGQLRYAGRPETPGYIEFKSNCLAGLITQAYTSRYIGEAFRKSLELNISTIFQFFGIDRAVIKTHPPLRVSLLILF